MAELLIRVRDKVNADDFYANCKCSKRGDVVVICPDGWPWSQEERTNRDWRILAVPGVPEDQLAGLLAPELDTDPQKPSKTLQRRWFKLDLSNVALPLAVRTWLVDDTRAIGVYSPPKQIDIATIVNTITVQKVAIADPAVVAAVGV